MRENRRSPREHRSLASPVARKSDGAIRQREAFVVLEGELSISGWPFTQTVSLLHIPIPSGSASDESSIDLFRRLERRPSQTYLAQARHELPEKDRI